MPRLMSLAVIASSIILIAGAPIHFIGGSITAYHAHLDAISHCISLAIMAGLSAGKIALGVAGMRIVNVG